jgi:hypothetical protein
MANRFTEMTGATVRFLTLPPETIEFRLREDVRTGANLYHGAIVSMWHLGGYVVDNIILPIDDLIPATETPGSSDAEFHAVSQLRSLEDRQYALPIDGDCQLLYFQNDILESDEIAAAFQSETGREWSIPGTWTDLIAMATWWSARGQNGVALGLAPVSMAAFPFRALLVLARRFHATHRFRRPPNRAAGLRRAGRHRRHRSMVLAHTRGMAGVSRWRGALHHRRTGFADLCDRLGSRPARPDWRRTVAGIRSTIRHTHRR